MLNLLNIKFIFKRFIKIEVIIIYRYIYYNELINLNFIKLKNIF